jgi:hypothetical protein
MHGLLLFPVKISLKFILFQYKKDQIDALRQSSLQSRMHLVRFIANNVGQQRVYLPDFLLFNC